MIINNNKEKNLETNEAASKYTVRINQINLKSS